MPKFIDRSFSLGLFGSFAYFGSVILSCISMFSLQKHYTNKSKLATVALLVSIDSIVKGCNQVELEVIKKTFIETEEDSECGISCCGEQVQRKWEGEEYVLLISDGSIQK